MKSKHGEHYDVARGLMPDLQFEPQQFYKTNFMHTVSNSHLLGIGR